MNQLPVVVGLDEQSAPAVDVREWVGLARTVLIDEGVDPRAELNVTFVDRDEMTELNRTHMGGTGPTDVLSFPIDEEPMRPGVDGPGLEDLPPRLLGDVVICPAVVADQAPGPFDDEMALMVVHGVLHILGMDHGEPAEAADMRAAELRHLEKWRQRR